jgi:hypothetical protein
LSRILWKSLFAKRNRRTPKGYGSVTPRPGVVRNTLQLPYRSLESIRDLLTKSGEGDHILSPSLMAKWLNLTRIELSVFTDNESAIELYRKFGFEIEGTLRKYAFRDGKFVDAYAMARVK